MRRFNASAVAAEESPDLNVFSVVLAENLDGTGERLELQRALSFDEQDIELGQDTYCLSTDDGRTCYGGVTNWTLEEQLLVLRLDAQSAMTLGVEEGFGITVPPDDVVTVREGLTRVFA